MTSTDVKINIAVNDAQAKAGLDKLGNQFQNTGAKIEQDMEKTGAKIGTSLKNAVIGIGASIVGLWATFGKWLGAYQNQVEAEFRLQAAMKATGGFVRETFNDWKDYASQLQKVTGVDDDAIIKSMAFAKQIGIQDSKMKDTIKTALDMSAAFGIDLNMAIRNMGTLMQGEIGRLGMYLPKLKEMKEQGASAAQMMEYVGKAVGGTAVAINEASGGLKGLTAMMGDFGELLGKTVFPIIKVVIDALTGLLKWFENLSEGNRNAVLTIIAVTTALLTLAPGIYGVVTAISALGSGILAAMGPVGLIAAALGVLGVTTLPLIAGGLEKIMARADAAKVIEKVNKMMQDSKTPEEYAKALQTVSKEFENMSEAAKQAAFDVVTAQIAQLKAGMALLEQSQAQAKGVQQIIKDTFGGGDTAAFKEFKFAVNKGDWEKVNSIAMSIVSYGKENQTLSKNELNILKQKASYLYGFVEQNKEVFKLGDWQDIANKANGITADSERLVAAQNKLNGLYDIQKEIMGLNNDSAKKTGVVTGEIAGKLNTANKELKDIKDKWDGLFGTVKLASEGAKDFNSDLINSRRNAEDLEVSFRDIADATNTVLNGMKGYDEGLDKAIEGVQELIPLLIAMGGAMNTALGVIGLIVAALQFVIWIVGEIVGSEEKKRKELEKQQKLWDEDIKKQREILKLRQDIAKQTTENNRNAREQTLQAQADRARLNKEEQKALEIELELARVKLQRQKDEKKAKEKEMEDLRGIQSLLNDMAKNPKNYSAAYIQQVKDLYKERYGLEWNIDNYSVLLWQKQSELAEETADILDAENDLLEAQQKIQEAITAEMQEQNDIRMKGIRQQIELGLIDVRNVPEAAGIRSQLAGMGFSGINLASELQGFGVGRGTNSVVNVGGINQYNIAPSGYSSADQITRGLATVVR